MLECTRCGFRGNSEEYIRHALSCLAICTTCRQHVSVAGFQNHDCHIVLPPLPEDIPIDPEGIFQVHPNEQRPFDRENYTPPFISMIFMMADGVFGLLKEWTKVWPAAWDFCSAFSLFWSLIFMSRDTDMMKYRTKMGKREAAWFIFSLQSGKYTWVTTLAGTAFPFLCRLYSIYKAFDVPQYISWRLEMFFIWPLAFFFALDLWDSLHIVRRINNTPVPVQQVVQPRRNFPPGLFLAENRHPHDGKFTPDPLLVVFTRMNQS